MKIRSITLCIPMTWPLDTASVASAARMLTNARHRYIDSGFDVQSICLATPPFLDVLGYPDEEMVLEYAARLDELAAKHQIDDVSIGPVVATTPLALLLSITTLPRIIAETERIFSGVLFADKYSGVNLAAAHTLAQAVGQVAQESADGLGNLRLAALANVPPFVPFAPAAYQHGGAPGFSIAMEAADLALTAISAARSITQAHQQLVASIQSAGQHLLNIATDLVDDHSIAFKGIDFSLTPYPQQGRSIGEAVEKLGIDAFGGSGTLFAMSFLTNAVREADIPHIGFSGVRLPILGDEMIARRADEGRFSVNDLLLYSAISNAGLDLIPIPGSTSTDELAATYLDMAALALYTGKPLAARLLPIPDNSVGQKVDFNRPDLAVGRVLPVKNLGAQTLFEHNSFLRLSSVVQRSRSSTGSYKFPSR